MITTSPKKPTHPLEEIQYMELDRKYRREHQRSNLITLEERKIEEKTLKKQIN
jgi:hypothetical protein